MIMMQSDAQKRYIHKIKSEKRTIHILRILLLIVFLVFWEYAANRQLIDPFIFCSPSRIYDTFIDMWKKECLPRQIGITLSETLISFFLVTLLSIFFAVLLWSFPRLSQILEPTLVVLNSLPKSALAPLLIVWLGANTKTIITAGLSVAIFGSILSLKSSFSEMDQDKLKLIRTLGGTKRHTLFKVILPGSVPCLFSNMKVNIGLCLVGVIIGEFIGAHQGLGYIILYGSQVFKLDRVIMAILILCFMAMALYTLISMIEKQVTRKT